jgi:peroxiredoxin
VQLVELQRVSGELVRQGFALFAISYDSVDTLKAFAEKNGVTFPLLSDAGSTAIRELGMLDEHLDQHHAEFGLTVRDEQRGVCYPGVFVLDERGTVTQRRFQRNYRVRESGAGILEQALGLAVPETSPAVEIAQEHVGLRVHIDSPTYWRYQRLNAIVQLDIAPGWHVYASPTPEGYTPLRVDLQGDFVETGQPQWPASTPFHIDGLDERFETYQGQVRVVVPFELVVPRGEPMGDRTVHVEVQYQACDDSTCDLPRQATAQLTVRERNSVE